MMLVKGGLGVMQGLGQQRAYDEYADKYNRAMGRAQGYMDDPGRMYAENPALMDMRRMRMGGVQSRQLARTGGTLGGNYARQLMREGAAFDQAALQQAIQNQMSMAGQYAPYAAASAQTGGPLGVLGGVGQQMVGDYAFNQFLGGVGGGTGVPMVSQLRAFTERRCGKSTDRRRVPVRNS
jgi:hypothetical protein